MGISVDLKAKLAQQFLEIFGSGEKAEVFFAPGRVNIIGEHIDYNGGNVLPCALTMGTYALIRRNDEGVARFASTNFGESGVVEISLEAVKYEIGRGWANYPAGILAHMQMDGHDMAGFDVLFSGDIPNGAGLSSSASIEVVMADALNKIFTLGYNMLDIAKLAKRAENQFCGVNCGIMDQFAVAMCRNKSAVYLNCDTLEHCHVPLHLGDYAIVIMDTNKRRKLKESKYNERRAECEQALYILSKACDLKHLADLSPEEFAGFGRIITDGTIYRRARHVVTENRRVKEAVEALKAGEMAALGALLTKSHVSLRDDYEVSCIELDTIVAEALKSPVCAGARMTGAGFGGCAIALVKREAAAGFIEAVAADYEKIIGYAPNMYLQEILKNS